MLTSSWAVPQKTSPVYRQGGGDKSLQSKVHRAQGRSKESLGHRSGGTFQPARAWGGRLQLSSFWEDQKLGPLCTGSKRELLDREIWCSGCGWYEQEELRTSTHQRSDFNLKTSEHSIKPVYNLISCKMLHTKYCKPVDKILFHRKKNYPIWAFFLKIFG